MIVGVHSKNSSADRRKFVQVQTPLLFGQFILDFFWVSQNAHLGQNVFANRIFADRIFSCSRRQRKSDAQQR